MSDQSDPDDAQRPTSGGVHITGSNLQVHGDIVGGDKVGGDERTAIENAIASLKESLKSEDVDDIQSKTQALAQASMKLGEAMYKAQAAQGGTDGAAPGDSAPKDDNVVDAEFSEVDDEHKKGAA